MTRYVAAGDLSLRSAGLALVPTDFAPDLDWRRVIVRTVGFELKRDAGEWERAHRFVAMSQRILDFLSQFEVEHTYLEQYAFSQGQSQSHALGELGGAVKLRLYEAGMRWSTVNASSARVHLGKFPAKGAKLAAHAVLSAMGCPADWQGDERDAFICANAGLIERGFVGISVPREPSKKVKGPRAA